MTQPLFGGTAAVDNTLITRGTPCILQPPSSSWICFLHAILVPGRSPSHIDAVRAYVQPRSSSYLNQVGVLRFLSLHNILFLLFDFPFIFAISWLCQAPEVIIIMPASQNRAGAHSETLKAGCMFSRVILLSRLRVGELCSLLFLPPFQPHVFQVCFRSLLCVQSTQFPSSFF